MKKKLLYSISILILASVLASCGGNPATPAVSNTSQAVPSESNPAPQPTSTFEAPDSPTSTPDPCSSGQIEAEVQKVHRHMREFDDASVLASKLPRDEVSTSVAELQRIRREAEDEKIPACLTDLKGYQVDHMN